MTTRKTTEKKRPEPKTPANDAESGVVGAGPVANFYFHEFGRLPPLPAGPIDVGHLADVFYESGYFGELTPAQIAVHIIAGRSLGLDAAQSVFDLDIKPGPVISYKQAETYQETADVIDRVKAGYSELLKNHQADGPPTTPDPALPADSVKSGVVLDGNFVQAVQIEPVEPLREREISLEERNAIYDRTGGAFGPDPDAYGLAIAAAEAQNVDSYQKSSNLANNGPVLNQAAESSLPGAPATNLLSAATIPPSAGPISDEPQPEIATVPDRDGPPTAADLGRWRNELLKMAQELGLDVARIMIEYDALDIEAKRQKVDSAWSYYKSKVSTIRDMIRDALAADGKPTVDSQAGFYMFADVPSNPDNWTYPEAQRADRALVEFFKRPTAPAA